MRNHRNPVDRRCSSCGAWFEGEHWQRLCWKCWRAQRDRELEDHAYDRGYSDGYRDGAAEVARSSFGRLDRDVIVGAIRLCHPDRHPPERAAEANAITARLLALRGTAA